MADTAETLLMNDALGQVGAQRIIDLTDGSPNANWCKTFYVPLRQALLRSHNWNFATARQELAQDAVAPPFGFSFSYTLPGGLLKIVEYNGQFVVPSSMDPNYWWRFEGFYKIEGRSLLTNDAQVKIVFIKDIDNPALFDSLFGQALATLLASKLASSISKNARESQILFERAMNLLLPLAAAADGQEGTITPYIVDDLTWGR